MYCSSILRLRVGATARRRRRCHRIRLSLLPRKLRKLQHAADELGAMRHPPCKARKSSAVPACPPLPQAPRVAGTHAKVIA